MRRSLLDHLDRRFGRHAVPHLTAILVAGQSLALALYYLYRQDAALINRMLFVPADVLQGEWWRLLTFMLVPPAYTNLLFAIIGLYVFYLLGSALEAKWGHLRYNVYLFIAWAVTVGMAFVQPGSAYGNEFIQLSVFLAFAYLFPEFEFYLFFVLPVKVKYLGYLAWGLIAWQVLAAPIPGKLTALASVANFFIFFASDIARAVKTGRRRMATDLKQAATSKRALHTCAVCGATEHTHRDAHFRVCSQCTGGKEYCEAHLREHAHH